MIFEWDERKAASNQRKHGVAFSEAVTVFDDAYALTFFDDRHSDREGRFFTLGLSDRGRLILLWHTERRGRVRLITARQPTRTEQRSYTDARTP